MRKGKWIIYNFNGQNFQVYVDVDRYGFVEYELYVKQVRKHWWNLPYKQINGGILPSNMSITDGIKTKIKQWILAEQGKQATIKEFEAL